MKKILQPVLLLFLLFTFVGCNQTTQYELNYDEFDYIEDYDEVFNRREGTYLVYVYSLTCAICQELKPTILNFADTYEDNMLYFFNVDKASPELRQAYLDKIGLSKLNTPVLLVIVDNDFDKTNLTNFYFDGKAKIPSIINDIQNGTYEYLK